MLPFEFLFPWKQMKETEIKNFVTFLLLRAHLVINMADWLDVQRLQAEFEAVQQKSSLQKWV